MAIFAALLSFFKFSHCEKHDWVSPDNYIHGCYTDIAPLYTDRALNKDIWPYASGEKSVEYPTLMGVAMYLTALPMRDVHDFYFLSIFALALLFIASVLLLQRIGPYGFYYALAPAVIGSLYINWDLWAIPTMLLAIYWFDKERYDYSAIALGISVATKFFPVLLLIPIIIIFLRNENLRSLTRYAWIFAATWLVINLPVAISTPTGWWNFYKFNIERGPDWGSIWTAAQIFGWNPKSTNFMSLIGTLTILAWVCVFLFGLKQTPTLAEVSFIVFTAALVFTKVYSPQYVLWLTALAVIALKSKQTLIVFWIWQVAELIYHIAIWQHLASLSGAKYGLDQNFYGAITLLRLAAAIGMIASLVHYLGKERSKGGNTQGKPWDFLFESSSSYP